MSEHDCGSCSISNVIGLPPNPSWPYTDARKITITQTAFQLVGPQKQNGHPTECNTCSNNSPTIWICLSFMSNVKGSTNSSNEQQHCQDTKLVSAIIMKCSSSYSSSCKLFCLDNSVLLIDKKSKSCF